MYADKDVAEADVHVQVWCAFETMVNTLKVNIENQVQVFVKLQKMVNNSVAAEKGAASYSRGHLDQAHGRPIANAFGTLPRACIGNA